MGIMATVTATTAMGIMAMAMAMAAVITGMAIRMDRPAGVLPGHPV